MMQMQDNYSKPAGLSTLSDEELEVLEKVFDYTDAREAAAPTGKSPLVVVVDASGLAADDMAVYLKMAEGAKRRNRHDQSPAALPQARSMRCCS